jgi:hypothetical protein
MMLHETVVDRCAVLQQTPALNCKEKAELHVQLLEAKLLEREAMSDQELLLAEHQRTRCRLLAACARAQ